jgi:hypothetical protein
LSAGAAEAEAVEPSSSRFESGFGSGCNTRSGLGTVPSLDQVVETDMGGRFVYKNQHLFRSECHDMPVNAVFTPFFNLQLLDVIAGEQSSLLQRQDLSRRYHPPS